MQMLKMDGKMQKLIILGKRVFLIAKQIVHKIRSNKQ